MLIAEKYGTKNLAQLFVLLLCLSVVLRSFILLYFYYSLIVRLNIFQAFYVFKYGTLIKRAGVRTPRIPRWIRPCG